jgi:hypothetical protein
MALPIDTLESFLFDYNVELKALHKQLTNNIVLFL